MKQFRDDLLASCLTFILALPKEIVAEQMEDVVPAIQVHEHQVHLRNTVEPVYKGHQRESTKMSFIERCPLYGGLENAVVIHVSRTSIISFVIIMIDIHHTHILYYINNMYTTVFICKYTGK